MPVTRHSGFRFPCLPIGWQALLRVARACARRDTARRRMAAAWTVVLLLAWTQLFLGVHELRHVGQPDASACKLALVASTLAGGAAAASFALAAPALHTPVHVSATPYPRLGVVVLHNARAPPAFA